MTILNSTCILTIETDFFPIRIWKSDEELYEELYELVDTSLEFRGINKLSALELFNYLQKLSTWCRSGQFLFPITLKDNNEPTGEGMFSKYVNQEGETTWFKTILFIDPEQQLEKVKNLLIRIGRIIK
jgi:hypothetical protein